MPEQIVVGNCTIELLIGDITSIPVDAIVNAANAMLAGGGGVDGAIHRAGGPTLMQELRKYDGCPTGSAVVTSAGNLPAKFVFHAVGPVYHDRGDAKLLASCYKTALRLAEENHCTSISFPAISTGVYGYPLAEAASVSLNAVIEFIPYVPSIRDIKLVQFGQANYNAYEKLFREFRAQRTSAQTS